VHLLGVTTNPDGRWTTQQGIVNLFGPSSGGDQRTEQVDDAPRRRVVERTLAWIARHRRWVRDYEGLPTHHEAMVRWTMVRITSQRLAKISSGNRLLAFRASYRAVPGFGYPALHGGTTAR
jgi:hypothetical protein